MAETVDLVDNRLPVILCNEQFGIVAKDQAAILARESNRHPMFGQFAENICRRSDGAFFMIGGHLGNRFSTASRELDSSTKTKYLT
jgi:hypothetical protein